MSELTKKLDVDGKKVTFYTTTEEASQFGNYGPAIVDGLQAYYALGQADVKEHGSEFKTNLKVKKNNILYYMLTQGIKPFYAYTGLYKMSDLLPESFQTMTEVDLEVLGSQNQGLLTNLIKTDEMFSNCHKLESLNLEGLDTSNVTSMYNMFCDKNMKSELLSLSFGSKWNTSKVTNMHWLFYGNSKLTSLDLSKFDTSKVTDMSQMFSHMDSIKKIDLTTFDTSNVTIMDNMFNSVKSLETLIFGPKWNTSKVTNMSSMFADHFPLEELDLSKFDFANVTTLRRFFSGASKLKKITWPSTFVTTNVKDMGAMFHLCSSLTSVPQMDTSNVTSMASMYEGCSSLTSIPQMNTSKVTSMASMFNNCKSLTTVPLMNTSKVTSMSYMFNDCTSLTTVPQIDTSNVTDMSCMFKGCSKLPATFPWAIDCSKITNASSFMFMFMATSVTNVTLKNVKESIKSGVTSAQLKGDDTLTIEFI